jgi:hypothetical protein
MGGKAGDQLAFAGDSNTERLIPKRPYKHARQLLDQHMAGFKISIHELDWHWEQSLNERQNWALPLHIHYRRSPT